MSRVDLTAGGASGSLRGPHGSVLVSVLWCLSLLSIVVIGVLHTSRMDLLVVKNFGDRIQAHYLALAGAEKAKALLFQDAKQRSRSGINHSGQLFDSPDQFRDVRFGRGQFRVFHRARPDEGGGVHFGVSDEECRLNVNNASSNELSRIEGVNPDVIGAIVDWRDEDSTVSPGGAESDYYLSLQPPYLPRNGSFQTTRELLMVRGISPVLLHGRDQHLNGILANDDATEQTGLSDMSDLGWSGLLTVNSSVNNVSASGVDRVNVQSADETALTGIKGITPDIAKAIVAWRGQNRFSSIADLLDVVAAQNQNQPGGPAINPNQATPQQRGNAPGANIPSGPKVIDQNLLMEIADDLTTDSGSELPGVININSASLEVLTCLEGVSRELAQAIISYRQANGFFPNVAYVLKVPGMTRDLFKPLAPRLTARSETFRIFSEGQVSSTGARQRIEEVVHVGLRELTTLTYREDDL
jgi:competence ComEA-like helix-hairpin-helix protein